MLHQNSKHIYFVTLCKVSMRSSLKHGAIGWVQWHKSAVRESEGPVNPPANSDGSLAMGECKINHSQVVQCTEYPPATEEKLRGMRGIMWHKAQILYLIGKWRWKVGKTYFLVNNWLDKNISSWTKRWLWLLQLFFQQLALSFRHISLQKQENTRVQIKTL